MRGERTTRERASRRPRRMILAQVPFEKIDERDEPGVGRIALFGQLDQARVGPSLRLDQALYVAAQALHGTDEVTNSGERVAGNRGQPAQPRR